jgi:hypothetical protein
MNVNDFFSANADDEAKIREAGVLLEYERKLEKKKKVREEMEREQHEEEREMKLLARKKEEKRMLKEQVERKKKLKEKYKIEDSDPDDDVDDVVSLFEKKMAVKKKDFNMRMTREEMERLEMEQHLNLARRMHQNARNATNLRFRSICQLKQWTVAFYSLLVG